MSTLSRKFENFQQFSASGTWVKKPTTRAILVVCIGGGRGGSTNGGSSSFLTCVGTGGGTVMSGTLGSGGDLNFKSGFSTITNNLNSYAPGCNIFGFLQTTFAGQPNTGCASHSGSAGSARSSGGGAMKLFLTKDIPDSVAVTVGAAGTGTGTISQAGQVWIFEVS